MPYRRFVIVSHLRSGTHLLRTALESHPAVVCQSEVFNSDSPDLPYPLTTPTADVLARWVYHRVPSHVACVGFVLQAYHPWGLEAFPGIRENPAWGDIWDRLEAMNDLRVIHLRRDNALRRHLSHVMARRTGAWHDWDPRRVDAITHLKPPNRSAGAPARRDVVTLDARRLTQDFEEVRALHEAVKTRFAAHAVCTVSYEELCQDFDHVGRMVQAFLGVPTRHLQAAVSKLDRRSLAEAIANYDALKRHFANTPWAAYFDEEFVAPT